MATAYELLGITRDASRSELEAAAAERQDQYSAERHANAPDEIQRLAAVRRAEIAAAYTSLRAAVTAPVRLSSAAERRRDRETIVALLVLVVIAALLPLLRDIAVPPRTLPVAGADAAGLKADVAAPFTLPAVGGEQVSLADYQGQVVLINLWATWCPPCVRETPRLVRLHDTYRDQGFVVLGVNTTFQDERVKVEQFVRDQGISYPVLLDINDSFGLAYRARVLPTSYLIDRSGKIVQVRVGEIDEAQFEEQIVALLKDGNPAP